MTEKISDQLAGLRDQMYKLVEDARQDMLRAWHDVTGQPTDCLDIPGYEWLTATRLDVRLQQVHMMRPVVIEVDGVEYGAPYSYEEACSVFSRMPIDKRYRHERYYERTAERIYNHVAIYRDNYKELTVPESLLIELNKSIFSFENSQTTRGAVHALRCEGFEVTHTAGAVIRVSFANATGGVALACRSLVENSDGEK